MPLNFGLAPKRYPPIDVEVTAEQIEEYALASGDDNPHHRAGPDQVASLVFPVVPAWEAMRSVSTDPELGLDDPLLILHGEQEFRYQRPIRAGDALVITPVLELIEDKGRDAVFLSRADIVAPNGSAVVEARATIFVRGGGSGAARPSSTTVEPPRRGAVAARFTRTVAPDMANRYARASGDNNPVHTDEEVARSVGLPGTINHGLGTLSLVAGGLVEHLAGGHPARVRRLQVRFTDMVRPGDELTTTVWRSAGDTFTYATERPGGSEVMRGTIELGAA